MAKKQTAVGFRAQDHVLLEALATKMGGEKTETFRIALRLLHTHLKNAEAKTRPKT